MTALVALDQQLINAKLVQVEPKLLIMEVVYAIQPVSTSTMVARPIASLDVQSAAVYMVINQPVAIIEITPPADASILQ